MRNSVLVPEERARLSGTSLKIIACISMLISHIIASGVWIQTAGLLPVKWETVSALYITGSILQLTAGRESPPQACRLSSVDSYERQASSQCSAL